ncbi:MAG: hypothetical protein KME26_21980 [Oscillatoria princeps RMCB-10]|nr:hypothetical protein [Oscillatoria princeps RMCB-10]
MKHSVDCGNLPRPVRLTGFRESSSGVPGSAAICGAGCRCSACLYGYNSGCTGMRVASLVPFTVALN